MVFDKSRVFIKNKTGTVKGNSDGMRTVALIYNPYFAPPALMPGVSIIRVIKASAQKVKA